MKNLRKLIKLEASVHLPVPFIELLFIFVIGTAMYVFANSFQGLSVFSIQTLYASGIITLHNNLSTLFLLNALGFSMIISLSMAGDLNNGFTETLLSYPVSRTELLSSKAILYAIVLIVSNFVAVILGMLFSPLIYPTWALPLYLAIVAGQSLLIVASALFTAIAIKKPIPSAMVLVFFWFGLSLSSNLIPTPYKYVLLPTELLSAVFTNNIGWSEVICCLVSLFIISICLFSLATLIFRKLQIRRGQE